MRFLVDECTGPAVAQWLRDQGHDVFSVYEQARGMSDELILQQAVSEDRILITNDGDFGEHIFRDGVAHRGVIFLRLANERAANKIAVLQRFLAGYADRVPNRFAVVSEISVRLAGGITS
jgi:predicted nuclease of predicted toxin-antitoxin system